MLQLSYIRHYEQNTIPREPKLFLDDAKSSKRLVDVVKNKCSTHPDEDSWKCPAQVGLQPGEPARLTGCLVLFPSVPLKVSPSPRIRHGSACGETERRRAVRGWMRGGVAVKPLSVWRWVCGSNCQLYVIPVCWRMRWRSSSGQNGFAVIRWTESWNLIGRERAAFTRSWEIALPLFTCTHVILSWQLIHKLFA